MNLILLSFYILVENSSKIGLANKDRKNRPMQQEDEYRIQMELNRYYLRKDSLSMGVSSEKSFYETETARTPSSRGKQLGQSRLDLHFPLCGIRLDLASKRNHLQWRTEDLQ
jgi:autophagy-related protein 2